MYCPKCGYKMICGCENCKDQLPEGRKPQKWFKDEFIQCPNCELTMPVDWWEKLDYDITFNNLKINK